MRTKIECLGYFLVAFLFVFLSASVACAASMSFGEVFASPGQRVTVPVMLNYNASESENVCAAALDISLRDVEDPKVEIGPAAESAGKRIVSNTLSNGIFRLGIFGLNQNVINGGVLANVSFRVSPAASSDLVLKTKASASDSDGNPLKISANNCVVHVE